MGNWVERDTETRKKEVDAPKSKPTCQTDPSKMTKSCHLNHRKKKKEEKPPVLPVSNIMQGEGGIRHVSHGNEFRYVVPCLINGDIIIARKFATYNDAVSFATTDAGIVAWKTSHPDDISLIGKIIECY